MINLVQELRVKITEKCLLNETETPVYGKRISVVTLEGSNIIDALQWYDETLYSDSFDTCFNEEGNIDDYDEVIIYQDFEGSKTYCTEIIEATLCNPGDIELQLINLEL